MSAETHTLRETLSKEHRVFERLADALDRSRLRPPAEMRELAVGVLDVLEPALRAHEDLERAALARRPLAAEAWMRAVRTAELQHDGIAGLVKDIRIILADPPRYRAEHLASLAFLLAKAVREHVAYEEAALWKDLPALDAAASPEVYGALRLAETRLGRL